MAFFKYKRNSKYIMFGLNAIASVIRLKLKFHIPRFAFIATLLQPVTLYLLLRWREYTEKIIIRCTNKFVDRNEEIYMGVAANEFVHLLLEFKGDASTRVVE